MPHDSDWDDDEYRDDHNVGIGVVVLLVVLAVALVTILELVA